MRIHLLTVVGAHVDVLPFMLEHYRQLGIESFLVNVHLRHEEDPIRDAVRRVAAAFGCEIASEAAGGWFPVMRDSFERARQLHPDDWYVLADQDELQVYGDDLRSLLAFCDRHGYDHVDGAFVDRVSVDGGLPAIDGARSIWTQFPLGAFLTYPLVAGDPRKVVAAKGRVPIAVGQHIAFDGAGCPIEDQFVQVHHFKWTAGLVERLRERASYLRGEGHSHWIESERLIGYFEERDGRIDLTDPRYWVAACERDYPFWPRVVELAIARRNKRLVNEAARAAATVTGRV